MHKRNIYPINKERTVMMGNNEDTFSNSFDDTNYPEKISVIKHLTALNQSGRLNDLRVTIGPNADHTYCSNDRKVEYIKNTPNSKNKSNEISRTKKSFTTEKVWRENEHQRREEVQKKNELRRHQMEIDTRKRQEEIITSFAKLSVEKEKESADRLAKLEAEEEQKALQQEIVRKNKIEQQKFQESNEIMEKIIPLRKIFNAKIQDITNLCKNCRDQNSALLLLNSRNESIQEETYQMESLWSKSKTKDLTSSDFEMAKLLTQYMEKVYQFFEADIEKFELLYDEEIARREREIKQAELEAEQETLRQLELENALRLQEEECIQNIQKQTETQVDSGAAETSSPPPYPVESISSEIKSSSPEIVTPVVEEGEYILIYPDIESLKLYLDSLHFLKEYELIFEDFVTSDAMKKMKFECQKALNVTINAISQSSREIFVDKFNRLSSFLLGKGTPNILLNPQAEAFSKNLLAKKIVEQGETSISSQPELAFPFAAIAVAIWNEWPEVGTLLIAHFHNTSSYLVPVFLTRRPDQSEDDYLKSLGYKFNKDGSVEDPDKYWKRLKGTMYLYASILITRQRQGLNKPHPHGIGNAWRWLAATLNMEPREDTADVCATLINIMLEVTGNDLGKTYPKQFPKMLKILSNVYFPKLKNLKVSGPVSRLGELLSSATQKGYIPPPAKQLPPNFW